MSISSEKKVQWSIGTFFFLMALFVGFGGLSFFDLGSGTQTADSLLPETALATGQYRATGSLLVVGTASSSSFVNAGDYKGTLGNDSNYWSFRRTTTGFDAQLYFDNVELYSANKILITIESTNITTGSNYVHQICDFVSTTGVDNAVDAQCTGGGWRTLQPRRTNFVDTTDNTRVYEIYDGYFSTRVTSPGIVVSTPLSNFINASNNSRFILRSYSTVNNTVEHRIDFAQVEVAVDPVYQPAGFATTSAGVTTNFISDLVGPPTYTLLTASDANKLTVPMTAVSTPADFYFSFKNVKTYTGMNTILFSGEICRSNTALTFGIYVYDFQNTSWTQHASTTIGASTCATDRDMVFTFNDTSVSGFNMEDHISSTGEIRVRFLTNGPGVVYNLQFDQLYLMLGSVNTDSSLCEISWGTGTAANCSNTRTMAEGITDTPTTATWQQTSAIEYPSTYYPLDNDDDAVNAEYAYSSNLSFPITLASTTSITGIHYAVKHRSNVTTITNDIQIKNFAGTSGVSGEAAGSFWQSTPGADINLSTTYGYFDSFRIVEQQNGSDDFVDTKNNVMNMRIRTSASTRVASGDTRDIDFAMMSVRFINEQSRVTLRSQYIATGGSLVVGTASSSSFVNAGDYKGTLGNDSNYWSFRRTTTGFDAQLYFDNVELYSANKLLLTIESGNITTGSNYQHQICDWVDNTGVDNAATAGCTGGGWRNLEPQDANLTDTTDITRVYEIYDGYFSTRVTSPGTIIATPLSNFASSTSGRIILRSYSTVNNTVEHRIDFAQVEVAIDPIYEPAGFATTSAGVTTNFISDTLGGIYTTVTGSDATKMTVPMTAISTAADFYYSFKNVQTYTGMNTILFSAEICRSNVALTFGIYLYDFQNTTWTQHASTTIGGATCATDADMAFTFNDTSIGGFNMANHISSTGEVRVRFLTNAPGVVYNLQFDRMYLMLGSVNSNSALCEISWGTGTAANCANTRTMSEAVTATSSTATWQQTSAIEYPSTYYALDNDDDAVNAEYAHSANISFPITVPSSTAITGIHYAAKFRSNVTTITSDVQLKNYAGTSGLGGEATGAGWQSTPGTDVNAATTYGYFDTFRIVEQQNGPDDFVDTVNNLMNLRLRSSASTRLAAGDTRAWDFAMMSVRYLKKRPEQYITMAISDTTVGFGGLSSVTTKYATGDTLGNTTSTTVAHTISAITNAPGGYTITLSGNTLTCTACVDTTLLPIGATPSATLLGTEQFGMRIATSSGNGIPQSPYNSLLWAFDSASFPDLVATGVGDETVSVYDLRYIANVESLTEAGNYNATLTYTITGSF